MRIEPLLPEDPQKTGVVSRNSGLVPRTGGRGGFNDSVDTLLDFTTSRDKVLDTMINCRRVQRTPGYSTPCHGNRDAEPACSRSLLLICRKRRRVMVNYVGATDVGSETHLFSGLEAIHNFECGDFILGDLKDAGGMKARRRNSCLSLYLKGSFPA